MIMHEIITNTKNELEKRKREFPLETFQDKLTPSRRNFKQSLLKGRSIHLIAEIKRKSPSKGLIRPESNIMEIATIYENHPLVNAISFLTDYKYFGGKIEEIREISKIITKPVLRKDFIIDEYQIYEARYFGADAILLIASLLSSSQMEQFIDLARSLNMDCLVEVHNTEEIVKLPDTVEIAGINNRNLKDFSISLETTIELSHQLKSKCDVIVTESGIHSRDDVQRVRPYADAMLVGTSIMNKPDIGSQIYQLYRPKVKICGITQLADALFSVAQGVDYLGFIFYEKSKRYISPAAAKTIIDKVKPQNPQTKFIGVFVNEEKSDLLKIMKEYSLDFVQLHGEENETYFSDIREKTIKVFRVEDQMNQFQIDHINRCKAAGVLLDTYAKIARGGTGRPFNWRNIKDITHDNLFLAGGLTPENVNKALNFKPDVLDINSGVEIAPGIKNHGKIETIMNLLARGTRG
ncbi:MAG: bifunctional indole-3-glycerol-phosphate synthase TrpC/phosphoribosylanthranilate isomerase TrpF [Fidelibacterota bacterium]